MRLFDCRAPPAITLNTARGPAHLQIVLRPQTKDRIDNDAMRRDRTRPDGVHHRTRVQRSGVHRQNRFGFEPEFTARVARMNLRIYEVGVSYSGRKYAQGKKVSWKDGVSALRCIIKYNLSDRL